MSTSSPADADCDGLALITIKAERHLAGDTAVSYGLTDILRDDSQAAFRRFLDVTLRLCNAGSAGLSLLRVNQAGQSVIRWEAVSGALASHEGKEAPRDSSPCGVCLEAATPTILPDPQREFPLLAATLPWISEDMIVPLYDEFRTPIGTLWIAHHDASRFGVADMALAQQLALLLERALDLCGKARCRRIPLALLESHEMERRAAVRELAAERSRREYAEAAGSKLRDMLVLKNVELQDAHHRVKNTIQIVASFLHLQGRKSPSAQTRAVLREGCCRLYLLAEVHKLLYKGGDEAQKIPLRNLLQTVAEALELSFFDEFAQVQLRMAIEPIMLAAADAIPLASLVNEALTNAYKHAFPGRAGEITLSLQRTAGEVLVLQISDDGIGLPVVTNESGLGLELMHAFAAQLCGTLVFTTSADSSGTTLTLTVPGQTASRETLDLLGSATPA